MLTVYDETGNSQTLNDKLAAGGEGSVYPLAARPADVLVKIYHPDVLEKRGSALETKVNAMTTCKSQMPQDLSWPALSVFSEQRKWIGYGMRRATGASMFALAHAKLYLKHFPSLNRDRIAGYLINYLNIVEALHRENVCVGDFNLRNILCDPNSDRVTLIDCDSYQFEQNGRLHPCPVISPDMTPIEIQNQSKGPLRLSPKSDLFSVAIVLFKALMLGRHPYDVIGGENVVDNIKRGHFPYGTDAGGIPRGHWYNIWSHMPYRLKNLFIQTFKHGAQNPAARPETNDWIKELKIYQQEIAKGWHQVAICPAEPKKNDYRGNRSF